MKRQTESVSSKPSASHGGMRQVAGVLLLLLLASPTVLGTNVTALLEHCSRFRAYERGIAEDLLPWYDDEGISEALMDKTIATRTLRAGVSGLPFCIRDGKLYVIDGKAHSLASTFEWQAHNIVVYANALRSLVSRWGASLPDVEFVVETQDTTFQDLGEAGESGSGQPAAGGVWSSPHSRLPVMRHCRADSGLDITIPTFHFYTMPFDEDFLSKADQWAAERPWEARKTGAFAAGTTYHRHQGVAATTKAWDGKHQGQKVEMVRREFSSYLTDELRHPNITYPAGNSPIAEWSQYRMVMHVDGISCSSRLPQLLALGSVVLREMSGYGAFFDKLLQKFVHYVPFWSHRPREVVWAYNWVNSNEAAARRIAAYGSSFARDFLNRQGVECYWALLLRQYAKVLRFTPGERSGGGGSGPKKLELMPVDEWLTWQEGKISNWGPTGVADRGKALHLLPPR